MNGMILVPFQPFVLCNTKVFNTPDVYVCGIDLQVILLGLSSDAYAKELVRTSFFTSIS